MPCGRVLDLPPASVIFGTAGVSLGAGELDFFASTDPAGFILFERNCANPAQVKALTAELRACVGREDAPVLIDQEGGRIARMAPPTWGARPAAQRFGDLWRNDPGAALEAARLNAQLIASDLRAVGISADCVPVLDVPAPGAHAVIGDRAFASDPEVVAALGGAMIAGLAAGGIAAVIKHLPGHGRAGADSHTDLPVVDASRPELEDVDFAPFRALNFARWGMTAHVVYTAIDPARPASTSAVVIQDAVRGAIGFDGLLLSDDIGMDALTGGYGARATACLDAGCDIVLHCSGDLAEMKSVAEVARPIGGSSFGRWQRAIEALPAAGTFDTTAAAAQLAMLLKEVA